MFVSSDRLGLCLFMSFRVVLVCFSVRVYVVVLLFVVSGSHGVHLSERYHADGECSYGPLSRFE